MRSPCHLPRQKRYRVFKKVEDTAQLVQLAHGFRRRILQRHLLAQGKDRQVWRTQPRQANELDHVLQQVSILPGTLGSDQHARQAMVSGRYQTSFGVIHCRKNRKAVLRQLLGNGAYALASNRISLDIAVNDQNGKLKILVHAPPHPGNDRPEEPFTSQVRRLPPVCRNDFSSPRSSVATMTGHPQTWRSLPGGQDGLQARWR